MMGVHLPWTRWAFFSFWLIFSLLPLSFFYLGPMLISAYAICSLYFLLILVGGWNWKPAVAGGAVLVFICVYVFFGTYSLLISEAEKDLIFKDSLGFIFYPAYLPLVALMVNGKIGRGEWERFLITLGVAVSIFHVVAYVVFYELFGVLTFETLTVANKFLSDIGTASKYATGGGVLRVDSGLGVLLIIPVLIVLGKILNNPNKLINIFVINILFIGIVLEGHRALLIFVVAGCIFYLVWIIFATKKYSKILSALFRLAVIIGTSFLIFMVMYNDDFQLIFSRFSDFTNGSGSGLLIDTERSEQFMPLIKKIAEAPLFGNGFGANASLIRNPDRPYMYELDYLAVFMKLGLVGGFLYFSSCIYLMYLSARNMRVTNHNVIYFLAGICYFAYGGTNGGFAMSLFSTQFHLYLMIGLSLEYHLINQDKKCKINSI